jgi:mono/diheme cytochrome c family protein
MISRVRAWGRAFVVAAAVASASPLLGAADAPPRTGAEVWGAACAACHGSDGAGQPRALVGFEVPLPDLRDCTFATSEPTADWIAVVHEGGPVRGLNQMMPAFRGALRDQEIAGVVDHVRGFCRNLPAWPLGELNLPRALFTEKAFPENEVVLTSTITLQGAREVANELVYEQRLGARTMFEVGVPFGIVDMAAQGGWTAGLGDLGFAVKRVLVQSANTGTILSVGLDVSVPTASRDTGLGASTTVFDPFVALGQILPAGGFVQAQAGADLPVETSQTKPDLFWRAALGWSVSPRRYGRMVSPMLEVLGAREIDTSDAVTTWDLAPQVQVTLSRRKHVRVDAGLLVPLNETANRQVELAAYLLWDWFEGSPFEGW